ncbi:GAF domain-containing sensor histidine kinase [Salinibacillus xinjiangensis]|uniref:histidine kinase n=1 Tax=Salinibacillus xinjiangensis TaxID=1229268 RepID=A0A6G1X6Q1_9BACI|nr:GAF domain-containing sensor histidine kinase [Salinibacillus xinjiangensis]MRG86488.1 GAF domain-containing protein [Salinibacillus xinjiangensis]
MEKNVKSNYFQRESSSKIYMTLLSILGWILVTYCFLQLQPIEDVYILSLMIVCLALALYYPIPVWRGHSSISFPVTYVLYLLYGLSYTLVIFAIIIFCTYALRRHPFRIVWFNPAQLSISFYIAVKGTEWIAPILESTFDSPTWYGIAHFLFLLLIYYGVNNLLVDIVLLLRPQKYTFEVWKHKMVMETIVVAISLIYGISFYILGSQNRGEIDVVAFFFFFSPLIGLSLLSSVIARLKKEKNRLKALFSITAELNNMLPTKDWLNKLKTNFRTFLDVDACILWIKQNGEWVRGYVDGNIQPNIYLSKSELAEFDQVKEPIYYENKKKNSVIAAKSFHSDIQAFVYTPLVIEGETLGMFVVGRSRTKSFMKDDIQSIATLANQLAVAIKTKSLIEKQEQLIIVEERNRIAREIHDGVAQTLAGAIMKLETAERKYRSNKQETFILLQDSIQKMRLILKEVRDSIYALRPNPTSRITLSSAIMQKINSIENDHDLEVSFDIRGEEKELSSLVEKVMYETFQEAMQNSIKHSRATKIHVLLSYQTEHILLKVTDNGVGFSLYQAMIKARNHPHYGILNINEAADKINASLQIDSKEGKGTDVTLTVPRMGLEGEEFNDQSVIGG